LWRETKDVPDQQATTMETEMEYPNRLLGDGTSMVVPTHSERSDLCTSTAGQAKQLRAQYHQIHALAQLWCVYERRDSSRGCKIEKVLSAD